MKPLMLAQALRAHWTRNRRRYAFGVGIAWVAIVLFLCLYKLDLYPVTWFDEGSHLHVPKALVQRGVYADVSSEGYRYFGPTIGVGPPVMLPIALAFRLAGIGLVQARLVIVAYLVIALVLFAVAAWRRYGLATAGLASGLVVVTPGVDLVYIGRQVLGEVPAFAYLLLGVLLWWRSLAQANRRWCWLLGAGVALGLAALTKSQFGLVLAPTIVLLGVLDRCYYRQATWWHFLVPLGAVVGAMFAGYALQFALLLGSEDPQHILALWRDATGGAIFVFSPGRILSSLKFLLGPDVYAYWGLPALAYGVFLARERNRAGLEQAFLVVFVTVTFGWFAFASIGWPRYAFPAVALLGILVAKLLLDVAGGLIGGRGPASLARGVAVALGIAILVGHSLVTQVQTVASAADRSPQLVAAYLNANVPPSAIIETWEPELGFLTDHQYHYPPSGWLDRSVRAKWLGSDQPLTGYDPVRESHPSYFVVGRFGKYTGIYAQTLARPDIRPVGSFGDYDVYRVVGP